MSQNLITPQLVAREALVQLDNNLVMGNLVHRDYSAEFVNSGDTVNVRQPAVFSATTHDGSTLQLQDVAEASVPVKMDKIGDVSFVISSKDQTLGLGDFSARFIAPAAAALAQKIDADLAGLYANVPYYVDGTATPAVADIAAIGKILSTNKAPLPGRNLVVGPATNADYVVLDQFLNADKSGATDAIRDASMGRVLGLDCYMDQNVVSHVKGDLATNATLTGTAGNLTGTIASGGNAKSAKVGDIFTIADTTGQYVVTKLCTTASDGTGTLEFYPALPANVSGKVITIHANHTANIAFQRNAFALVTRPMDTPLGGANAEVISYNGLSVRVVYSYDMAKKANVVSVDILYGVKTLRPELACRFCD